MRVPGHQVTEKNCPIADLTSTTFLHSDDTALSTLNPENPSDFRHCHWTLGLLLVVVHEPPFFSETLEAKINTNNLIGNIK